MAIDTTSDMQSDIQKVATTSAPVVNETLVKLREVFPHCIKDGKIDLDALKAFFDAEGGMAGSEKYGLSWVGKSDAFRAIQISATGTLAPQKNESKDWDTTENMFIEGDNLEVLKLLQKHYYGAVKMIYIDPPYNTGKDFVYKDNFTESVADYYERTGQTEGGIKMTANTEKNGRYHSDWLSMMYPRLFLAKNLLREDGVIFVSIDDNEVANLRLIMDEIFGEENYLNTFCWVNNLKGRQISGSGAAKTYEYILAYSRNVADNGVFNMSVEKLKTLMPSSYKGFDYETENDESGDFVIKNELYNTNSAFNEQTRPNLVFNIHYNFDTKEIKFSDINENIDFENFTKIAPKKNNDGTHSFHAWRWSKDKITRELSDLKFIKVNDGVKIFTKIRAYQTTSLKDVITDISTTSGLSEIKDLFKDKKYFDYPKPTELIKIFISQSDDEDIILDFFAGSGTTAHAVMAQNAEDGGNRKWICVQIPEEANEESEAYKAGYNTISAISRERIRRAGDQIGRGDIGFKAFSLSPSNYRKWRDITADDDEETLKAQMRLFAEKPLVDDYNEESVVYEVMLKEGMDMHASVHREQGTLAPWIIESGKEGEEKRTLVVSFAKKVTKEQVDALKLAKEDTFVCPDGALDDTTKVNISRSVNLKVI